MKSLLRYVVAVIAVLAMAVAGWGQSRGGGATSSSSGSVGSTSSSTSSGSRDGGFSSSGSVSYSSPSPSYGSSRGGNYSGGTGYGAPNLTNTSWTSYDTWMQWNSFIYNLRMMYSLNYGYFSRFSRNVEPLATPELVRLTYRKPLKLSLQMLDAVDELADMLQEGPNGKPIDRQAVVAKIQEIREINKQIQKDQGLDFMDQRRDKEAFKAVQIDKLDSASLAKFREAVTDLSTKQKNTYSQTTPAVVSVQSLSQPSFKSMCKEIDKMGKALESSARRM